MEGLSALSSAREGSRVSLLPEGQAQWAAHGVQKGFRSKRTDLWRPVKHTLKSP